jgi:microcystin-dependent protein
MTSRNRDFLTFTAHQKPTVGDIKMSAIQADHMGWLICDGRSLPVSDWVFLFNTIGYQFGGTGSNFYLPNPAGTVPGVVGVYVDSNLMSNGGMPGDQVGEWEHQLTGPEMPAHRHKLNDSGHAHTYNDAFMAIDGGQGTSVVGFATVPDSNNGFIYRNSNGGYNNTPQPILTSNATTGITMDLSGNDQYHNNVQPTTFMGNMFIYSGKVGFGAYPYTAGYYSYPATNSFLGGGSNVL